MAETAAERDQAGYGQELAGRKVISPRQILVDRIPEADRPVSARLLRTRHPARTIRTGPCRLARRPGSWRAAGRRRAGEPGRPAACAPRMCRVGCAGCDPPGPGDHGVRLREGCSTAGSWATPT